MIEFRLKTISISDFIGWNKKGEIVLAPQFQRRKVWSDKAKSFLIDTIIQNLPIPGIFIREKIDTEKQKKVREVVDGQQRLTTIFEFANDEFQVLPVHNKKFSNKKFSELPAEVKEQFLNYDLAVGVLIGASDADVLDIFARLNSYTIILNDQEKLNAEFNGYFKQTAYSLGRAFLKFWEDNNILKNRQIIRMEEAELASELILAMLDGLQDKKKKMKEFYKKYDNDFPDQKKVETRFNATVQEIKKLFPDGLSKSKFSSKTLFYSLFCVVYNLLYGLEGYTDKEMGHIDDSKRAKIVAALERLDDVLTADEPPAEYAKFLAASSRRTTDLGNRKIRHETILKEIERTLRQ